MSKFSLLTIYTLLFFIYLEDTISDNEPVEEEVIDVESTPVVFKSPRVSIVTKATRKAPLTPVKRKVTPFDIFLAQMFPAEGPRPVIEFDSKSNPIKSNSTCSPPEGHSVTEAEHWIMFTSKTEMPPKFRSKVLQWIDIKDGPYKKLVAKSE